MRGALTVSQSETDKAKPTNLKSVLTFSVFSFSSVQFELCVHIIKMSVYLPLRIFSTFLKSEINILLEAVCKINKEVKLIICPVQKFQPTGNCMVVPLDYISLLHCH